MLTNVPNLLISVAIFLIHFPFGFYRVRYKKFSRPWSRCLYIPIVLNIVMRRFVLNWEWSTAMIYLWPATLLAHLLSGCWGSLRNRPHTEHKETKNAKENLRSR